MCQEAPGSWVTHRARHGSWERNRIDVKCNMAEEKVLLMDNVKASYRERKRQHKSDRHSFSIIQEMPLFVILKLGSWKDGDLKRTTDTSRACLELRLNRPSPAEQAGCECNPHVREEHRHRDGCGDRKSVV